MSRISFTTSELYFLNDAMKSYKKEMEAIFTVGHKDHEEIVGEVTDIQEKITKELKDRHDLDMAFIILERLHRKQNNEATNS